MLIKFLTLAVSLFIASPSFAMAKEGCGGECASCHSLTEKEAGELLKGAGGLVKSVKQAPARGLYELLLEKDGKQGIVYMDYGKKNIIQGVVLNLETLQPVAAHVQNLPRPKQLTSIAPETIPVEHAFTMGNPKGTKRLYVFTDPDCPYCRKLHVELKRLEKIAPDVAIHIMLYPLQMHPQAYDKSRAILAKKSRELLDSAFEGKAVPKLAGDAGKGAVDRIIQFSNANGITGTPTMVMPDGKVVVGIRDAEALKRLLGGV